MQALHTRSSFAVHGVGELSTDSTLGTLRELGVCGGSPCCLDVVGSHLGLAVLRTHPVLLGGAADICPGAFGALGALLDHVVSSGIPFGLHIGAALLSFRVRAADGVGLLCACSGRPLALRALRALGELVVLGG